MKLKYFIRLLLLFLSAVFIPSSASADDNQDFTVEEARYWMDHKGQEILEILTLPDSMDKYDKLDKILYNDIDLDYAAKFVIGKYWKKMPPEQQEEYVEAFKNYTSALYKSYPTELDRGTVTYTIDKVIPNNDSKFVHCTIFINSVEQNVDDDSKGGINVIFRIVKNSGKIQVRDLQIAESGFLRAYRDRFYKMIHEDNDDEVEWFLEDLKQITADMEKEIAEKIRQETQERIVKNE